MAMSTVVFGVLILFVVASMIHFLHEWWEARRSQASDAKDDRHH